MKAWLEKWKLIKEQKFILFQKWKQEFKFQKTKQKRRRLNRRIKCEDENETGTLRKQTWLEYSQLEEVQRVFNQGIEEG